MGKGAGKEAWEYAFVGGYRLPATGDRRKEKKRIPSSEGSGVG
jgi:hypothetical protein